MADDPTSEGESGEAVQSHLTMPSDTSWLVVWFRNGKLHAAKVCRSKRTMTRTANRFNEYAQLYNRGTGSINLVGIINDTDLLTLFDVHSGLPKHQPIEKLKRQRQIREFKNLPVRGGIQ